MGKYAQILNSENLKSESVVNNSGFEESADKNVNFEPLKHPHDPRPDLTRDSFLWQQLLASAFDYNDDLKLYSALLFMRAMGTGLKKLDGGQFTLRLFPYIDPTGNNSWPNQSEYDRTKVMVLDPVRDGLFNILKKMAA